MDENNNDEQIFNEDELQDIMSEFEALEQEYQEVSEEPEATTTVEATQDAIKEEGELKVTHQLKVNKSHDNENNVVPLKAKAPTHKTTQKNNINSEVSMSMEFPIGERIAQIGLNPEYGFSFSMDGVELTIDDKNGCVMTLPGGMTFTLPLEKPSKQKKSA